MTSFPEQPRLSLVPPPEGGLPLGQIIPGTRYRVLSKIGQGGMGAVYAAEHIDLEKKVAIKVLRSEAVHDPKAVDRFRDEARAASKVGSEFICDVTDFGQTPDGRVFFVMEMLAGQSLGKALKSGRMAPEVALPILRQMCKALGAAHDKGIVHLDVKPDNIMLVNRGKRSGAVKVVDFGISGLLAHARGGEAVVSGTPEYMAPERYLGKAYDHRADVYSLGIVAYEMLSGSLPFEGDTPVVTLTKHVREAPPPFREKLQDGSVPDEIAQVVMQILEKDPQARPANMAVVEAMLCEAQIAAHLRTEWDDLELPAVDEDWHRKLAARMPRPWDSRKKAIVFGSVGAAVLGGALALYFGLSRGENLILVEATATEEVAGVGPWLEKAQIAARAQRYTEPLEDSALGHIERAEEANAARRTMPSPGAQRLRRTYASALAVIGEELQKANLRELAVAKFREAWLFTPDDAGLQAKADLSLDEGKRMREQPRLARAGSTRTKSPMEQAKDIATRLFLAAREGRVSEARHLQHLLESIEQGSSQAARMADALRKLAAAKAAAGSRDEARALYGLVASLDPSDGEAKRQAAPMAGAGAGATGAPPEAATAPMAKAVPPSVTSAPKKRASAPGEEPIPDGPRDPARSKAAASEGERFVAGARFAEAEAAFNRAVTADPTNHVAVAGLAEVNFERARYSDALDYARRAARLSPKTPKYQRLLGDAHFKLLRWSEAKAAYQKALALVPGDPSVEARLRQVRIKLGE
jgi:tetratricopeptide (TPR) repeat protein/tRNA A-37 threonylcarbamoyl transferase component Bud32